MAIKLIYDAVVSCMSRARCCSGWRWRGARAPPRVTSQGGLRAACGAEGGQSREAQAAGSTTPAPPTPVISLSQPVCARAPRVPRPSLPPPDHSILDGQLRCHLRCDDLLININDCVAIYNNKQYKKRQ